MIAIATFWPHGPLGMYFDPVGLSCIYAVDKGLPACGQTTYIHLLLLILLHIRMLKINLPVINPVAMSLNNNS